MTQATLVRRTLTDFFRDAVQGACRAHAIEPTEHVEFYLVNLLERFAHPQPGWDSRPLALDYLESFHSAPSDRYAKLKHVADTALFLSGMFMEHLEQGLVSTDYYMSIGRLAYLHLGDSASSQTAANLPLFREMAVRFPDFVRVLSEISFTQLFPGDRHTVRIYTRWLRTRGRQDTEWLLRHGIVPVDPGRASHH